MIFRGSHHAVVIVDHQQQTIGQRQRAEHQPHQLRGDGFALASHRHQEVVIVLVVVADSGCPDPSSHCAPATGKQVAMQLAAEERQNVLRPEVHPGIQRALRSSDCRHEMFVAF